MHSSPRATGRRSQQGTRSATRTATLYRCCASTVPMNTHFFPILLASLSKLLYLGTIPRLRHNTRTSTQKITYLDPHFPGLITSVATQNSRSPLVAYAARSTEYSYISRAIGQILIIDPRSLILLHHIITRSSSHLSMAPKRSEKKPPPTPTSATTADAPSKSSRVAWKQGDQLEYMLSHWESFVTNQNEKKLDRFWPRVYDGWYKKWPITPSLESIGKYGSRENAILALRSENNNVSITSFYALHY